MEYYNLKDLKDLYRICNKYWKTGDIDYLAARHTVSRNMSDEEWLIIENIVGFVTRKHFPVKTALDVLEMLGFKSKESEEIK